MTYPLDFNEQHLYASYKKNHNITIYQYIINVTNDNIILLLQ